MMSQELLRVAYLAIYLEAEQRELCATFFGPENHVMMIFTVGHHTTRGGDGVGLHTPITLAPDGAHRTAAAIAVTEALQVQGQGPLQVR